MLRKLVLVTGAGGFIGHHLVTYLVAGAIAFVASISKMPEYAALRCRRVSAT